MGVGPARLVPGRPGSWPGGGGSLGHLVGGPLRSVLARARWGCCAGKGVLDTALAEGCPPGTPENPRVPEKVQQPPGLPWKGGVCGGGAPLQPRWKGQATAGEGTAEWTKCRGGGRGGRHLEQAHGAGLGAGETCTAVPGGPEALTPCAQAAARCGARRASLVVRGPGLPPHLGLSR